MLISAPRNDMGCGGNRRHGTTKKTKVFFCGVELQSELTVARADKSITIIQTIAGGVAVATKVEHGLVNAQPWPRRMVPTAKPPRDRQAE
jgi:hypothetical protein